MIFQGGDNVNPCPIDKLLYFTRLQGRNPVSSAICVTIVKVLDQKKILIKQLLLKFMA